jgi:hypothetical protein
VNAQTGISATDTRGAAVAVPSPSNATPQAPGTAVPGTSADYSRGDHVHPAQAVPSASNATPQAPGTAVPGTSADYSRGDHVHPAQDAPWTESGGVVSLVAPASQVSITGTTHALSVSDVVDGEMFYVEPGLYAVNVILPGSGGTVGTVINPDQITVNNDEGTGATNNHAIQLSNIPGTECAVRIVVPAAAPIVPTITATDETLALRELDLALGGLTVNGAAGNVGDVLTSAGAGAAPTWQAPGGTSGGTLGPFVATPGAPYVYTPTGAEKGYVVELRGADGGGGAAAWLTTASSGSNRYGGGGGGGGGYTFAFVPASLVVGAVTLTCGAKGTGAVAPVSVGATVNAGSAGGDSTFGALLRAGGGGGGPAGGLSAGVGGAAGTGMYPGGAGSAGSLTVDALTGGTSSFGGGGGGGGSGISSTGSAGADGGAGGAGASANYAYSASAVAGGTIGVASATDRSGGAGGTVPTGSPYGGGGGGGGAARASAGGDGFSGGGGAGSRGGGGGAGVCGNAAISPRNGGDGDDGLARMWVLT